MIELIVLNWLQGRIEEKVFLETPDRKPPFFVLIEKTSDSRSNLIHHVTFAFQSYAPSLYEAASLNERVKAAVDSLIEHPSICSVSLNSNYNYTDTQTGEYRYQAVYDLTY